MTIDHKLKDICDSESPLLASGESPNNFIRRIAAELDRRRREIGDKNATGRWLPNNVAKLELSKILDWIQDELDAFKRGQSVNQREDAEKTPRMIGRGESNGTQSEFGISAAD